MIKGKVTLVFETTTENQSRQVTIAVATGISHTGTNQNNGVIEQRLSSYSFLFLQLLDETRQTVHMGRLYGNQILNHCWIVPMVRETMVACPKSLTIYGEHLT